MDTADTVDTQTKPLPPAADVPGRSLGAAVVTALILVGLMILCYILGPTAFFVLAAVVVSIALFELLDALVQTGHRPSIPLGVLGGFGMMLVAFLQRPVFIPVIVASVMFCAFFYALRPGRGPGPISDVAWTLLGLMWIGGGGAAAVSMLRLGDDGVLLLIGFVFITALNDIGAYFAGTNLGRRKMAPSISPGKSWEGAIGGSLVSIAAGAAFGGLLFDISLADGLALGMISGTLAPVGDLIESMAKREIGIKDSGRLLPGHGGFLDRLDAILFCAPAAFLYLRFVVF